MRFLYFLLFLFLPGNLFTQNIVLNEIMQSNVDNLFVGHDFPDSWVELYNTTDSTVSITNWRIGVSNDFESAYKITSKTSIKSKSHLTIYCDKVASKLHTDFRLDANGGFLFLFGADGSVVDSLNYPAMLAPNIAYGRVGDGDSLWHFELTPSAGLTNGGGGSNTLLPKPVFSVVGQVLSAPVDLEITMPEGTYPDDAEIYVTYDGSEPSFASEHGTSFSLRVDTTIIVRAKILSREALSQPSAANSYIFHPRQTTLPIISVMTSDEYLYSDSIGIMSSHLTSGKENYKYNWRRPMNVEFLNSTNGLYFNQLGECGMAGAYSRRMPQKSFKIVANKRFGNKRFKGNFFPDKPSVDKAKSYMIRNSGTNCKNSRINDAIIQRIYGTHANNVDYQSYIPVIAYVNGIYKGVYEMRERSNDDYIEANYNGLEDVEVVSHTAYTNASARKGKLFSDLYNAYMSDTVSFEYMSAIVDIDNFVETLICEMYASNSDYPHNNVSMWRLLADGAKWRWILKDMDYIQNKRVNANMFKYMFVSGDSTSSEFINATSTADRRNSHYLYEKMISFPEVRDLLIDKYAVYLGDFLKPAVTIPVVDEMVAEIDEEIPYTFAANDSMAHYSAFVDGITDLKNFFKKRSSVVYKQMAKYFGLGSVVPMRINRGLHGVSVNGVFLTEADFDGAFFSDRKLRLFTESDNCGWKMMLIGVNGDTASHLFESPDVTVLLKDYLSDEKANASVAFEVVSIEKNDYERRIEQLGIDNSLVASLSLNSSISLDEPRCAFVNIISDDGLPKNKNNELQAFIEFHDNNGSYFKKKIILAQQGSDDNNAVKQNLALTFCEDDWIGEETTTLQFGKWVPQDEFHLKAYYGDAFCGTSVIANKLYGQIIGVDSAALTYLDAFPCVVFVNGDFYGQYAWQLKKQRKNMGLPKDDGNAVWLDGTLNDKQLFQGNVNWTKFEVRNPKTLYNLDGTEYDGDDPHELLDNNSNAFLGKKKQEQCNLAKQNILLLSSYYQQLVDLEKDGASEEVMRNEIAARFDVDRLIQYMLFSLVSNNYKGFSKNWQWFTTDGKVWSVAPSDCSLSFGYNEDYSELWDAEKSSKKYDYRMLNVDTEGPMLWIKKYFWEDLKKQYANYRTSEVISTENIVSIASDWYGRQYAEDRNSEREKWNDSPCFTAYADSLERFEEWTDNRIRLLDDYLLYAEGTYSPIVLLHKAEKQTNPYVYNVEGKLICTNGTDSLPKFGKGVLIFNSKKVIFKEW